MTLAQLKRIIKRVPNASKTETIMYAISAYYGGYDNVTTEYNPADYNDSDFDFSED